MPATDVSRQSCSLPVNSLHSLAAVIAALSLHGCDYARDTDGIGPSVTVERFVSDSGLNYCISKREAAVPGSYPYRLINLSCKFPNDTPTPVAELDGLTRLTNLKSVDLTGNKIQRFDPVNFEQVNQLVLDGNPLDVDVIEALANSNIANYSVNIIDGESSSKVFQAGAELEVALVGAYSGESFVVEYSLDRGASWQDAGALNVDSDPEGNGLLAWVVDLPLLPDRMELRVSTPGSEVLIGQAGFALRDFDAEACDQYQWEQVTEMAPFSPRDGAGLVL